MISKHRQRWTESEDVLMDNLLKIGKSRIEIAEILGRRPGGIHKRIRNRTDNTPVPCFPSHESNSKLVSIGDNNQKTLNKWGCRIGSKTGRPPKIDIANTDQILSLLYQILHEIKARRD